MMHHVASGERYDRSEDKARTKLSRLLQDKEQEWAAVAQRKGPLRLLDLPVDVLKEIVKEVTHTNDLTALALTHSALHTLAIPHIYSRFDIVWPDTHPTTDPRTGVDALTYGLATLVMGEDVFNYQPAPSGQCSVSQGHIFACTRCGTRNQDTCDGCLEREEVSIHFRRLGNSYPQYTRKFSIGNGPSDWVKEYMITKESGKMLGTLVALAVARMVNLEQFVWDMPTGVLRDVWLALSSLQRRHPPGECRLEKVWVRWHDNQESNGTTPLQSTSSQANSFHQVAAGGYMTPVGLLVSQSGSQPTSTHPGAFSTAHQHPSNRIEYPSLSVLPPLRSLSVLDIDEVAYLDEMSVLIERSQEKLRELRVGISSKAQWRDFVMAWDGAGLQQVDREARTPAASNIGEKRLGGVLGTLLGRVYDIRKKPRSTKPPRRPPPPSGLHESLGSDFSMLPGSSQDLLSSPSPASGDVSSAGLAEQLEMLAKEMGELPSSLSNATHQTEFDGPGNQEYATPSDETAQTIRHVDPNPPRSGKLKLEVLELERVPLSVAVLQNGFDWEVLTSLTILDCPHHESLWRALRRQFQPQKTATVANSRTQMHAKPLASLSNFRLNLNKIHTDAVSPALVAFLKETLAPNTLEVLFLQDRRRASTGSVTLESIFRGPIKRHRASLRKLLIDSSDRLPRSPNHASETSRYKAWMANRDALTYITSGRMKSLRELSIAIEYRDWHFFLQRLPKISHLRSLNIPFIDDHASLSYNPRELALQIVDIIFFKPEIELCYVGIANKCFEILENKPQEDQVLLQDAHNHHTIHGDLELDEDEIEDDDGTDEDEDEEEEEGEEEDDDEGTAIGIEMHDDSDISEQDDSDSDSFDSLEDERSKMHLRLREILFYDDKVAIFKARHGRL